MPSIRQADNIGEVIGSNLTVSFTMFEANLGMSEVQAGDALVAFVYVPDTTAHVTSITDNYGNTWTQIPGARATSSDAQSMVDIWWAQNVAQVTDPGNTFQISASIDHNGSGQAWGIVVFDVEGINGATTVLGSSETNSTPSLNGPALNGGSGQRGRVFCRVCGRACLRFWERRPTDAGIFDRFALGSNRAARRDGRRRLCVR
jgi:hypothetical protein